MSLTQKQNVIMKVILAGNPAPDIGPVDIDQLLDRLPYNTTKASIQFSIRALIKHGLIEKGGSENRRGRRRTLLTATAAGSRMFTVLPSIPVPHGLSFIVSDLEIDEEIDIELIEETQSLVNDLMNLD